MYFKNLWQAFITIFKSAEFRKILLAIDRFGNALCGGDPYNTVSGRVGYFAHTKGNRYWKMLEKIINFTFKYVDGENHCFNAYKFDKRHTKFRKHRRSSDIALIFLAPVVVVVCLLLLPFIYIFIKGKW